MNAGWLWTVLWMARWKSAAGGGQPPVTLWTAKES